MFSFFPLRLTVTPRDLIYLLFIAVLLCACEDESVSSDPIIATVGDRDITLSEIRERAELTIRPEYCSGRMDRDKHIILNTLIAEKLLALDAVNNEELSDNYYFRQRIRGRKEQMMRKRLLERELGSEFEVTEQELLNGLKRSSRKFLVAFLGTASVGEAQEWRGSLAFGDDLNAFALEHVGYEAVLREIHWGEIDTAVEELLFADDTKPGDILGPVRTSEGFFVMQIVDERQEVVVGQGSLDEKSRKVGGVLAGRRWVTVASQYVSNLTDGLEIELNADGFKLVAEAFKPFHAVEEQSELSADETGDAGLNDPLMPQQALKAHAEQALLTVNGDEWTIREFFDYLNRRPLMFRAKTIPIAQFDQHMKLAIQDVLRDYFLTEEAYTKGVESDGAVVKEEVRWQDYLLAIGNRTQRLQALGFGGNVGQNMYQAITMLDRDLKELAATVPVSVDTATLSDLEVNSVQWMSINEHSPYPVVVPTFPILTNISNPDYFILPE